MRGRKQDSPITGRKLKKLQRKAETAVPQWFKHMPSGTATCFSDMAKYCLGTGALGFQ